MFYIVLVTKECRVVLMISPEICMITWDHHPNRSTMPQSFLAFFITHVIISITLLLLLQYPPMKLIDDGGEDDDDDQCDDDQVLIHI